MKFYLRLSATISLIALLMLTISWGSYFMNMSSSLTFTGAVFLLFSLFFVVICLLILLWKNTIKSLIKRGKDYAEKIA